MALTSLLPTDAHSHAIAYRECQFLPDFREKHTRGERVVAIIGCTYVFTDSILRAELKNGVSRLVFCDLNPQKAAAYQAMAEQAAERICPQRTVSISSAASIEDAVANADTIYVGIGPSFADTRRLLDTYRRHGVFVAIGDTLYSTGLAQMLLEYPTLARIRNAARRLAAPGCVIFATANPLPEVVSALAEADPGDEAMPVFGFCSGTKDLRRLYEAALGAENAGLSLEAACRNHLALVRVSDAAGRDVLPDLLDRLHPDRLLRRIEVGGPEGEKALENWPLAVIMHHYYDPQAGVTLTPESGVHGVEYLPRLFQDERRRVKPPADRWEHEIFHRIQKSEANRADLLAAPHAYELKTAWAVGRFDPWSQVLRRLAQDPELNEADLRNWGPAYVNVPNGDLFPELPPGAVVEVPTAYHDGRMFVYRNSIRLSDDYLELIYPHLQMVEAAGCIARSPQRRDAAELFEWLIDACPQVRAFLPERDRRILLARDLLAEIPNLLPE